MVYLDASVGRALIRLVPSYKAYLWLYAPLWSDYVEFYVSGSDLSELWLNSKSK
jgi:hypothetical protein